MTDWIEWNGGECPVAGVVDLKLRSMPDDMGDFLLRDCEARDMRWSHVGNESDIVAYRPVDAPGASTSALSAHPGGTHYSGAAIQPAQFITANSLQFLEGCIVKRAFRHDKPTGKGREDVEKIIHEAQLLLELKYGVAA